MTAIVYDIIGKHRPRVFSTADTGDFTLKESGQVPATHILENPSITLYSLDPKNGRAVFVETPPDLNLSFAPFYFLAQFDNALRVLTIPFETLIELAGQIPVSEERLVFIQSTGRSGSTLASKIFAEVAGVVSVSEPDALMVLTFERFAKPGKEAELRRLLDAVVRILCKHPAERAWVIKGRSYVMELADWLAALYPKARNLFLYRDAEEYLLSAMRTIMVNKGKTAEQIREGEIKRRAEMGPIIPLINSYDPDIYLPSAGILALMWLSVMERYRGLHEAGVEMLAIRYRSWREAPGETAAAMLAYCNCLPDDLSVIEGVLASDSQEGTTYAWGTAEKKRDSLDPADLAELYYHLGRHSFIKTADYQAPNSL